MGVLEFGIGRGEGDVAAVDAGEVAVEGAAVEEIDLGVVEADAVTLLVGA